MYIDIYIYIFIGNIDTLHFTKPSIPEKGGCHLHWGFIYKTLPKLFYL